MRLSEPLDLSVQIGKLTRYRCPCTHWVKPMEEFTCKSCGQQFIRESDGLVRLVLEP